jgi:hypothetical protein
MSEDSLTTLMWVMDALLVAWVPVALLTGKRSGASVTILVEALIISCIIAFEVFRRARKC